jgi:hypothetical protein
MKIVHTFWIDQGKDPLKDSFGWCSARYHLMSWALSCLQLHRFYDNVELITDTKGKELLIDHLKLPYKTVRIQLDDVDFVNIPGLWVMKKIYSYTLHQEPFLNVDGDVYIFRPFPDDLFHGQLIAQNIEQDFDYYKELVGLIGNIFPFVPYPISKQMAEGLDIQASNAGILGGNNHGFFKEYYQVVEKFISENQEQIAELIPSQMVNFNAVAEQYIFHCLSTHKGLAVNYLLDTVYDPSFFEAFANFHYLPNDIAFMHALGDYKKNGWVCDQLANRLRIDYPEYYYRIIGLFESQRRDDKVHGAHEGFSNSQQLVSSFSIKYSSKSEDEKFHRARQLILSIFNQKENSIDLGKFSISQSSEYLEKELTNNRSKAVLNDIFNFEKEKFRLIQSLPTDPIIFENEQYAIDNANLVFVDDQWKEKAVLKLSPVAMCIESQWDWSINYVLFTKIKGNDVLSNLNLEPYYYLTLLLPDKHHGEVIEYLMNPMEAYVLSLLSKEEYVSVSEIMGQTDRFFENVSKEKLVIYLEEAIRFLAYSGVVLIKLNSK